MGEMLKCHDTDRSCKEICQITLKIVIPPVFLNSKFSVM